MDNLQLKHVPISKTGMLIRKPVADVFEAFVNPDITTKFCSRVYIGARGPQGAP
jgi:hypothetical protein